MSQLHRRRVPYGNTVEFFDVTPRGLVKAKDLQEFVRTSPADFMPALKNANELTAKTGTLYMAVRVPVPKNLLKAPEAVLRDATSKLAYEAMLLGRVERIAGKRDPYVESYTYFIKPSTHIDKETFAKELLRPQKSFIAEGPIVRKKGAPAGQDGSALPCPAEFLDATPNGFMKADSQECLDDIPEGFLEEYKKAEEENPGQTVILRVPCMPGLSESEIRKATVDAAWKAYQKSGGWGRKGATGAEIKDEKTNQKKEKRAAGGGGIADKLDLHDEVAKKIDGLRLLDDENTDQMKDKSAANGGGVADTSESNATVGVNSVIRRLKPRRGRGTPLPILRQGVVTMPNSTVNQ